MSHEADRLLSEFSEEGIECAFFQVTLSNLT